MTDSDALTARLDQIRRRLAVANYSDSRALLGAVEEVLDAAAKAEHGALRWADPLPVPEWVAQIREAVSGKLLGEETGRA